MININIYKADKRNSYVTKFTDIICSLSYQKSVFGLDILPFNFLRDNPLYTDKKQQEFNDKRTPAPQAHGFNRGLGATNK